MAPGLRSPGPPVPKHETTLNKPFDRRFFSFIVLFAAVVPSRTAQGGATGRLNACEVAITRKEAENGRPPDLSRRDPSGLNLAELDFTRADLSESICSARI